MVHRIDSPGSEGGQWVGGKFGGPGGTLIAADYMQAHQEEKVGLVEFAGITPDKSDVTQVRQAVQKIARDIAGAEVDFTAGANLTAGQGLLTEDTFGVVKATVTTGNPAVLIVTGKHALPKTSADDIAQFERVYWDDGAGEITLTAGGNRSVGVAAVAAGVGITTIDVLLSGPPNL